MNILHANSWYNSKLGSEKWNLVPFLTKESRVLGPGKGLMLLYVMPEGYRTIHEIESALYPASSIFLFITTSSIVLSHLTSAVPDLKSTLAEAPSMLCSLNCLCTVIAMHARYPDSLHGDYRSIEPFLPCFIKCWRSSTAGTFASEVLHASLESEEKKYNDNQDNNRIHHFIFSSSS